jgi:hypothetical protein
MKADCDASLGMDALMTAAWRRGNADALLHHSDLGSQHASELVSTPSCQQRYYLLDEPGRQCLGQFHDGELLLIAEN